MALYYAAHGFITGKQYEAAVSMRRKVEEVNEHSDSKPR